MKTNRIKKIEESPDAFVIKTSDIHLPQRIGETLSPAQNGELEMHYDDEGYLVCVNWKGEE